LVAKIIKIVNLMFRILVVKDYCFRFYIKVGGTKQLNLKN